MRMIRRLQLVVDAAAVLLIRSRACRGGGWHLGGGGQSNRTPEVGAKSGIDQNRVWITSLFWIRR